MIIKKCTIIPVLLIIFLAFNGCNNIPSPSETVKPPQYSQSSDLPSNTKSAFDEYNKLVLSNSSPAQLITFLNKNIGNMKKEEADKAIKSLLNAQKIKIENYQKKLSSDDFDKQIGGYSGYEKYASVEALEKQNDNELKSFFQSAYADGFKMYQYEGSHDFEIDYYSLYKNYSSYISDEYSSYLEIMGTQSQKHYYEDLTVTITWDDLAARIMSVENFIKKYKDSEYAMEMSKLFDEYFDTYKDGTTHSRVFDYETNIINQDVLKSYESTITKYPGSKLAKLTSEYLDKIKANNYKSFNSTKMPD